MRLPSEWAARLELAMWVAESVRRLWLYALARGGPDADLTALVTHVE